MYSEHNGAEFLSGVIALAFPKETRIPAEFISGSSIGVES